MKPLSAFLPDLMPLVPSCPEPVAEHAVRRAAQRFCEMTRAWRVTLDPVIAVRNIVEYDLELPAQAELVRLEAAKMGTERIAIATPAAALAGGTEAFIYCPDGKTLQLNPKPQATQQIVITANLKPANGATDVQDFLADRYMEVIARGAASTLKQHPSKAYTDVAGGLLMAQAFEDACAGIRSRLRAGLAANNPPRVIPHLF